MNPSNVSIQRNEHDQLHKTRPPYMFQACSLEGNNRLHPTKLTRAELRPSTYCEHPQVSRHLVNLFRYIMNLFRFTTLPFF